MKRGLFFLLFMVAFVFKGFSQATPADSTEMYAYIDSVLAETRGPIKRTDFFNLLTTFNSYMALQGVNGTGLISGGDTASMLTPYISRNDTAAAFIPFIERSDTSSMLSSYIQRSDTASMLTPYISRNDTAAAFAPFIERSDTASMLDSYAKSVKTQVIPESTFYNPLSPRPSEVRGYINDNSIGENTNLIYYPPIKDFRQRTLITGYNARYNAFPVFMVGSKGEFFVYFRDGASHQTDGDAVLAYSTNGGNTWDTSKVYDWTGSASEYGSASAGLFERNDTLFATYRLCNLDSVGASTLDTCGMFYKYSTDRGKTWQSQTYIPSPLNHSSVPGEIVYPTVNGRTFVPIYGEETENASTLVYIGYFDNGESFEDITWVQLSGSAQNETDVIVDGDTLIAFIRTGNQFIRRSISVNNGESWSSPASATIDPDHQAIYPKAEMLPDGRIIIASRDSAVIGRTAYALSDDKGLTWGDLVRLRTPEDTTIDGYNMYTDWEFLTPTTLGVVYSVEHLNSTIDGGRGSNLNFTTLQIPSPYLWVKKENGFKQIAGSSSEYFNTSININSRRQIAFQGGNNTLKGDKDLVYENDTLKVKNGSVDVDSGFGFTQSGYQVAKLLYNGGSTPQVTVVGPSTTPTGGAATVVGYQAGNNSSSLRLTAVGYQAGLNNGNQNFVTAIGYQSLYNSSGANYGQAFGYQAGESNSGSHFTGVGWNVGASNSGDYSGFFGYNTGASNSFNGVYLFGHDLDADQSRQVKLGIGSNVPAYSTQLLTVNEWDVSTDETPNEGDIMVYKNGEYVPVDTLSYYSLKSGWAHYIDTAYATAADSFYVAQGSTLTLPVKADMTAALVTNYLPNGVDSLFSQQDSTILGIDTGASYTVRINFKAKNSSNTGYATLALDIGTGGTPNIATAESLVFPKGAGVETQESKTILLYSLDTFIANGCKIKVTADTGNLEIYDIRLLIRLDSRP